MKTKSLLSITSSLALGALATMSGCATDQKVTQLPMVTPDSGRIPGQKVPGYLIVYTATENPINTDEGMMYYPHTGYSIYDTSGHRVRSVANHITSEDENPSRVSLPPGTYTVRAESESDGTVDVPVQIRGMRTTVVNLEKRSHEPAS